MTDTAVEPTAVVAATPSEPPAPPTLSDQISRIEAALAARLGLNLDEFDGQEILTARANRIKAAGKQAAQLVEDAFNEAEMTVEQRVERIEKALKSGGSLTG